MFFNCTAAAGASREHKHLQVLPAPGACEGYPEGFRFFPDCDKSSEDGELLFTHFVQKFDALPDGHAKDSEGLLDIYARLLQRARQALGVGPSDDSCPHNFILTKRWMTVIPRRTDKYHNITANAAGMIGSVFLHNQDQLEAWKGIGPMNVLTGLGLPSAGH